MGLVPLASLDATPVGCNNFSAMNVGGGGPTSRWQQHLPPPKDSDVVSTENVVQLASIEAGQFVAGIVV